MYACYYCDDWCTQNCPLSFLIFFSFRKKYILPFLAIIFSHTSRVHYLSCNFFFFFLYKKNIPFWKKKKWNENSIFLLESFIILIKLEFCSILLHNNLSQLVFQFIPISFHLWSVPSLIFFFFIKNRHL